MAWIWLTLVIQDNEIITHTLTFPHFYDRIPFTWYQNRSADQVFWPDLLDACSVSLTQQPLYYSQHSYPINIVLFLRQLINRVLTIGVNRQWAYSSTTSEIFTAQVWIAKKKKKKSVSCKPLLKKGNNSVYLSKALLCYSYSLQRLVLGKTEVLDRWIQVLALSSFYLGCPWQVVCLEFPTPPTACSSWANYWILKQMQGEEGCQKKKKYTRDDPYK